MSGASQSSGLTVALLSAVGLLSGPSQAHSAEMSSTPSYNDDDIHPYHVQGQVWLMAGEPRASNVAVQIGDEGVLIVDTGASATAQKLLDKINQLVPATATVTAGKSY